MVNEILDNYEFIRKHIYYHIIIGSFKIFAAKQLDFNV